MITKEVLAPLEYIKKSELTGGFEGMRFKLYKKAVEDGTRLGCAIWPEPFNFLKTPDEEKKFEEFEFSEDGIDDAIRWMNQEWIDGRERFEEAKRWNLKLF